MTHAQIISQTSQRHLRTAAPALRIVPRHEPQSDLADIDVIAWAKEKAARGQRLVEIPPPEPASPRQSFKRSPELRYLLNVNGWWHFRKANNRKVVRFALKTRDLAIAQARRDEFLQNTQP